MALIQASTHELEEIVVPQAIFWRPIKYFSSLIWEGEDDLDVFRAASFATQSGVAFDLRHYPRHPDFTTSLYLSKSVSDHAMVPDVVNHIIAGLQLPLTAVAWRRGQPFTHGELDRLQNDLLQAPESLHIVLKMVAEQPTRTASVDFIKANIATYFDLNDNGEEIAPQTTMESWASMVDELIVSVAGETSSRVLEYANAQHRFTITDIGLACLGGIGFR